MPTNFPSSLDAFNNPGATDDFDDVGLFHDEQHANANDAIEALEVVVGTTGSPGVPRMAEFTAQEVTQLWIPVNTMWIVTGSPSGAAFTGASSAYEAYRFDSSTTERMGAQSLLPTHWEEFNVVVYWANNGAGSGDVRWQLATHRKGVISTDMWLLGGGTTHTAVTATAPGENFMTETTLVSDRTKDTNDLWCFLVARLGGDGADTLGNDVGLLGILVEKAS